MDRKEDGFEPEEHLARLRTGSLLLARDLEDPNFKSTVVLVCQHGEGSSYGLVLNRRAHMPLSEIFDKVKSGGALRRKVYIGGPVQPEELQILQITDEPVRGSHPVAPRVYLGGYWDELEQILSPDSRGLRLFLGYSGWGAGQLQREIALGSWEVVNADVERLLEGPEDVWIGGIPQLKRFLQGAGER